MLSTGIDSEDVLAMVAVVCRDRAERSGDAEMLDHSPNVAYEGLVCDTKVTVVGLNRSG